MKHYACGFVVAVLLLFGADAYASKQTSATASSVRPKWTLTVDPLTTVLGFVHLQVERSFGDYISVYASPHIRFFNSVLGNLQGDFYGLGIELCFRVFPLGGAPFGWWVSVRGVLANLWSDVGPQKSTPGGYVSVLTGYSWLFFGWLTLSAGIGAQYLHYQIASHQPDKPWGIKTFLIALHTNVGVAF